MYDLLEIYIHTITPVYPERLGRGIPTFTHSWTVCLGPHVIGGDPIVINRVQLRAATENFIENPITLCSTWESNPRPLA